MGSIVYYGHHKCASSWVRKILFRVGANMGWRVKSIWAPWRLEDRPPVRSLGGWIYSYGNAVPMDLESLPPNAKAFHVIRNPKDLLVSAYFSHKNSHPTNKWPDLVRQRDYLSVVDKERGLLSTMDFISSTFDSLHSWPTDPRVLTVGMEDLTANPKLIWPLIFKHHGINLEGDGATDSLKKWINRWGVRFEWLGFGFTPFKDLPYSAKEFRQDLNDFTFEKMSGGRKPGQGDPNNHYRKGEPGDWVNHFTPLVESEFNRRWPGIMEKWGYE